MKLNQKQKLASDLSLDGENIFITGPGGTGKSELVKDLKVKTKTRHEEVTAWTASTGIAAVNIGATTFHQWAGLGINFKPIPKMIAEMRQYPSKRKARDRILKTDRLLIDELGMIGKNTIDYADKLFRTIRRSDTPFGGIQIIGVGDFLQLPPISKDQEPEFAFESNFWEESDIETVHLDEIFRQKNNEFAEMLNRVRIGDISMDVQEYLLDMTFQKPKKTETPIYLHSHNRAAEEWNQRELKNLSGPTLLYKSIDQGSSPHIENLDKFCLAPAELILKNKCRVMLLRNLNIEAGLINGSCGTIIELKKEGPIVEFDNGKIRQINPEKWEIEENGVVEASRQQIPLRMAWAITIHKSQGMSLSSARMNLYDTFAAGHVYTALSRVRDPAKLYLDGIRFERIKANQKALEFYRNL